MNNPFDPALWADLPEGVDPEPPRMTPQSPAEVRYAAYERILTAHGLTPDDADEIDALIERLTPRAPQVKAAKPKRKRKPAEIPDGTKWCACCADLRPLEAFGKDKNRPDGLNRLCKACVRHKGRKEPHPMEGENE